MRLPALSHRAIHVWRRDLDVYRSTWKTNFLAPLLEPVLYVVAFGAGLGRLVTGITWQGEAVSYVAFIAPGLVATAILYNAFFECLYGSFVRMYYQKTFDAIIATPVSLDDVILGEVLWGATKSVIAAVLMCLVLTPFGLVHFPHVLLVIPMAIAAGFFFGSAAMVFTGLLPSIDSFNLPIFLLVTPMFLFSGTFFPLDLLPRWAQAVALASPLTHVVLPLRAAFFGTLDPAFVPRCLCLLGIGLVLFFLSLRFMRRRLLP